ncbi:hypothetical protein MMC28_011487 [Mycoblastus sanguinarius]|nr:hypothetical protein [Mycoblastus sanguinarius]
MLTDPHDVEMERVKAIEKVGIQGFRCNKSLLYKHDHKISGIGVADAFEHLSPVTDTDHAMHFLPNLVKSKGAQFLTETIQGDIREHEDGTRRNIVDVIVNASSLGGRGLTSDLGIRPRRGGILQIINIGLDFEKMSHALVVNNTEPEGYNIVFIVPRSDSILILGVIGGEIS